MRIADEGKIDWDNWLPDGRYPHGAQVHERLSFLRFLLKDGQLWLCAEQVRLLQSRFLEHFVRSGVTFLDIVAGETNLGMSGRKTSPPWRSRGVLQMVQ